MNTELQPVLDLLSGKLHWLPALLVWVGALKTVSHFLGKIFTSWTASALVRVVNSPDPEDDHYLLAVLDSRLYRLFHFVLTLFSLPLPTRADYDAALKNRPTTSATTTLLLATALAATVVGCASYDAQVFATEKLAADAAASATSTFNLYYHTATNSADVGERARLESARAQLYTADQELAATLTVVEGLRQTAATNTATTNQAALSLALTAVQSQSSNIVSLVQMIMNAPR